VTARQATTADPAETLVRAAAAGAPACGRRPGLRGGSPAGGTLRGGTLRGGRDG
jgi:hypothetical protein